MIHKIKEPNLSIIFAGIDFISPIGVGPIGRPWGKNLTPEEHAEVLLRHLEAGAGYICIPTCCHLSETTISKLKEMARPESKTSPLQPKQTRTMKIQTSTGSHQVEGMYLLISPFWNDINSTNIASIHSQELTKILIKKKPRNVRLIANVYGLSNLPESWIDGAKKWEDFGVDLIEINVSCGMPAGMGDSVEDFSHKRFPPRFQGMLIGDHPDIVENITREVVKAVKIPVGVKLSPETGFPRIIEFARRVRDAGGKWIQVMNMGVGIAPPNIYNRGKPLWPFADGNPFVSVSGSLLRPQCYKNVAGIAKYVQGIDIAAAGGLMVPEHIVEVMMLGARLTQLCTGVIERGRKLITLCDSFLKKFMVEQSYQTIEEIIGLGQQYIKYNEDIDLMAGKIVAETDELKCTGCGICIDNICIARYWDRGIAKTRKDKCAGCGGCMLACPVDAINLKILPSNFG
jgi:dihydropyrimidine dehydrogenase (NAD+) subunit PreA